MEDEDEEAAISLSGRVVVLVTEVGELLFIHLFSLFFFIIDISHKNISYLLPTNYYELQPARYSLRVTDQ